MLVLLKPDDESLERMQGSIFQSVLLLMHALLPLLSDTLLNDTFDVIFLNVTEQKRNYG